MKAERWRIDAFELWCLNRLLRVPWTAKRSNQPILKEISPGFSLEGVIFEAEAPILRPPDVKSWLIGKDPDPGKDWGQELKGTTENEMVGWHHWLNGHEFGQTLGVGDGLGGLTCCSPWGRKESDTTEWLNWTELFCHEVMEPDAMILVILPCHDEWAFVTHWNYKPYCVRATKDGWVIVESSDKMLSTGGGNGKALQYFCLNYPVNCIKR